MKALVVFHGEGHHPLDWLLDQRFKHCFCAISDGLYWILIDGKGGLPEIKVAAAAGFDLTAWYRERNCTVVETETRGSQLAPFMIVSCVSVAKAILGIRAWWIITPRQLFDYLR